MDVPGAPRLSKPKAGEGGNGADPDAPAAPNDVNDPKTPSPGAGEDVAPKSR